MKNKLKISYLLIIFFLKFHLQKIKQNGQSSVEYILMLFVMATIVIGLSRRIKFLMFGPGECPNDSLICKMLGAYEAEGYLDGRYRYFTLKR